MILQRHLPKYIIGVSSLLPLSGIAADLSFSGNSLRPVTVTPDKATGLDKIYVLYSVSGVTFSYHPATDRVTWYRYSNLGGGYAEEVSSHIVNGVSILDSAEGDMGYIIEDCDKLDSI